MKKILVLILALTMTIVIFAGCKVSVTSTNENDMSTDETELPIVLSIDSFRYDGKSIGDLEFTRISGREVLNSISIYHDGTQKTVAEAFAKSGYKDIKFLGDTDENFLGWI